MSTSSIQIPFLQSDGFARATRSIAQAVRKDEQLAVMIVHIKDVERICASVGHVRAGEILDSFSKELRSIARDNDVIERISDRKFAVLLNGLKNKGHASLAAHKIERTAQDEDGKNESKMGLNTSIGVVMCPEQGKDAHELMRLAEIASLDGYRKSESVCFFEEQSANQLFLDWGLEKRLEHALESGDLELHFQPKLDLSNDKMVGAEALMRWFEPEIGQISPDIFIDLAESTGQINELTYFAVQSACRQLSEWQAIIPDFSIAVNITPSIIQTPEIVDVLENAMNIWGIRPDTITMEVTENAMMQDRKASHDVLTQIRACGARVSIDDFGTGYSSLAYLKEIPADELKIDRSFVLGMLNDPGDYKIVEHSINIAKSFGLSIVAEGIESNEVLEELRKLGCDYAQGYFIGKPVPSAEFEALCRSTRSNGAT